MTADAKELTKSIKNTIDVDKLVQPTATKKKERRKMDAETLQSFMPKNSTAKVTEGILEIINRVEEDTGMDQDLFEEHLCTYTHLVGPGISFEKLINAIKFVTLREVSKNQATAYKIVFPEKTREKEASGRSIDSLASMYSLTKAVTEVQKLNILGMSIIAAPLRTKLLQKLMDLTNGVGAKADDYVSPTVQLNAAIAAYDIVKVPEENKMELKIGMSDNAMESQQNLADQLGLMAKAQMAQLRSGKDINEVQKLGIEFATDAEIVEN